jgi:uncharacterized low-complexity protein
MKKTNGNLLLTGSLLTGLLAGLSAPQLNAAPFDYKTLGAGAEVRANLLHSEEVGNFFDLKCGAAKDSTQHKKGKDGKCGAGHKKAKDAKCGAKTKDGSCGAHKDSTKASKATVTKDAGKQNKAKDGKCGEGKCGK